MFLCVFCSLGGLLALWVCSQSRHGEKNAFHYFALWLFFYSTSLQSSNGRSRQKQIAARLESNRPHFNVPPLRDWLLCYSPAWAPSSPPTYLYRESRRCLDLTSDKCFIQMLLSHIVEEVMNSRAVMAAGAVSPCRAWTRRGQRLHGCKIKFNVPFVAGEGA